MGGGSFWRKEKKEKKEDDDGGAAYTNTKNTNNDIIKPLSLASNPMILRNPVTHVVSKHMHFFFQ